MTNSSAPIIICGYTSQVERVVRDLFSLPEPPPLTLVCRRRQSSIENLPNQDLITVINGDPTTIDTLSRAHLGRARAILITADATGDARRETVDARTVLTALAVRKLNDEIPILAELRSDDTASIAADAGVNEWIVADHFSGAMLSQSIQSPGLSALFAGLFATGSGYALRELVPPQSMVGDSFSQSAEAARTTHLGALVGIRRDDELHLPPPQDLTLHGEDKLLVIQRVGQ